MSNPLNVAASEDVRAAEALRSLDPELARIVEAEQKRQAEHLGLIASENHCPAPILELVGSVLTDKYAEGYPGSRWYGGCECVDMIERLAIERAKRLFGAEHANVQPHAGSQANMAVYLAVLRPGSRILGMSLAGGGHLTHGHPRSFSGQFYQVVNYGVTGEGLIDYDMVEKLALEHTPSMIVAGASAYSRIIDFPRFRKIADEVGAYLMVDIAHIAGLVAAGVHPSPVPHADFVTSTTHKTLRGPRGAFILCKAAFADLIDRAVMPGTQGGPMMNVIAGKALTFELAGRPEFRRYQQQIVANARAMADEFTQRGFTVVSGGTDNHMFLLDLTGLGLSGAKACRRLALANITANKNAIPNDPRKPSEASGIRLGTPALTSRGMTEAQMRTIAAWIAEILRAADPPAAAARVKGQVLELCASFPVPH